VCARARAHTHTHTMYTNPTISCVSYYSKCTKYFIRRKVEIVGILTKRI